MYGILETRYRVMKTWPSYSVYARGRQVTDHRRKVAKKETWTNGERTAIIGVKRPTFDSLPAACGFTMIRQCWRVDALDGT